MAEPFRTGIHESGGSRPQRLRGGLSVQPSAELRGILGKDRPSMFSLFDLHAEQDIQGFCLIPKGSRAILQAGFSDDTDQIKFVILGIAPLATDFKGEISRVSKGTLTNRHKNTARVGIAPPTSELNQDILTGLPNYAARVTLLPASPSPETTLLPEGLLLRDLEEQMSSGNEEPAMDRTQLSQELLRQNAALLDTYLFLYNLENGTDLNVSGVIPHIREMRILVDATDLVDSVL